MVRNYTDAELLDNVKALPSYIYLPDELIIVVRSKADEFDIFDDKAYYFSLGKFFEVSTCTSNSGSMSLLGGFKRLGVDGSAIIKSGEIYYDVYEYGLHKGKQPALRQRFAPRGNMKYFRDGDMDKQAEEQGEPITGVFNTNFHFCSYLPESVVRNMPKRLLIGAWGEGCIVCNDGKSYYNIINHVKAVNKYVSLAVIKED